MQPDFKIKAHGKCILAGEHAVIRGNPALVFPIPSKYMELHYWADSSSLVVDEPIQQIFFDVLKQGLLLAQQENQVITGRFHFDNHIPPSAGMGFSAAFCVCLTKWFVWRGWVNEKDCFQFAKQLENYFHGTSSGVDIAGALSDHGVRFYTDGRIFPLTLNWQPKLYMSYSGTKSITAKCIQLVNASGQMMDEIMTQSVLLAEQALTENEAQGLLHLKEALQLGNSCFERWGLINASVEQHAKQLMEAGALATKPTGAGDGGFVLSLWDKTPKLPFEMIGLFS